MDNIHIQYDENNRVVEAYGFEPEGNFITVPSSVWKQFSIYNKEYLFVENEKIVVSDKGVNDLEKAKSLIEAKTYLTKTDYKMLNNYVPKEDEDLQAVITQRNTYREFIRENS